MPKSYLLILTSLETLLGLVSIVWLSFRAWQERQTGAWKSLASFAAMLTCLTLSSHCYCMHLLFGDIYPRWFFLVGEVCGPLDYLFCLLTVWFRFMAKRRWSSSQLTFSLGLFAVCLLLVYHHAIAPIQAVSNNFDVFSHFNNALIWPIAAALLAVALRFSQQTRSAIDTLFLQSVILILIAAIASDDQLATSYYDDVSWSQLGWAGGFLGLATTVMLDACSPQPILHRRADLAEWFSLRTLIGVSVFASCVVLLAGLHYAGLLRAENGTQLATILTFVYGCWCVSVIAAIHLSEKIRDVHSRMLATGGADAAFDAFKIKPLPQQTLLAEVDNIVDGYNDRVAQLQVLSTALVENERQVAIGKIAAQVAHDIRSPLAALSIALPGLSAVEEDLRLLLRDGVHRIQDIAQELLDCYSKGRGTPSNDVTAVLVSVAVEQAVSQARLQHRSRLNLSVQADISPYCACVCVKANLQHFKRILSNLLNNAVEAIEDTGSVTVKVRSAPSVVLVEVLDTGRGMPAELLRRLGEEGLTAGKASGNGLGVYQAKRTVGAWGGDLSFQSEPGAGTRAILRLEESPAPPWIQSEIWTEGVDQIIVLDDDVSIHRVWRERFRDRIPLISCATFAALQKAVSDLPADSDPLFFLDHELSGTKLSGVDIISQLGLSGATLVTSHFEDIGVITACQKLGVRLIPKALAASIPIR